MGGRTGGKWMVGNELQEWAFGGHVECWRGGLGNGGGKRARGLSLVGADAAGGTGMHCATGAKRKRWRCEGNFKKLQAVK